MLTTHIYINGRCREAIELYVKALNAEIKTVIPKPGHKDLVTHAEITIHGQLLMLNDFGGNAGFSKSGGYQLSVRFDNDDELKRAYSLMEEGSTTVMPMQPTDYSSCVLRFIDRYDVRWAFWV